MLKPRPKLALPGFNKLEKVRRLGHDYETYCDVNLKDVGADVYSRHPSCEVLMLAYTFDDGQTVEQWCPPDSLDPMPSRLEDALLDERVVKTGWNTTFEFSITKNVLKLDTPIHSYRCTQALAYSLALPGSLEKAGEVVEIDEDKKKSAEGRALMRLFSFPRKPTRSKPHTRTMWYMEPERWEQYKDYNRQDVRAEAAILRKLRRFDMPQHEWELFVIDQIINQRGIPFNMRAVDAAVALYEHLMAVKTDRLIELTGLDNPNSPQQLLPWMQDRGYPYDDCKKGHIERAADQAKKQIALLKSESQLLLEAPKENALALVEVETDLAEMRDLAEVLSIRKDTARSSPKKYFALLRAVDRCSNVLRNAFQFAGAGRTWRWAGRMFQAQNLPRPEKAFKKIMDMVVEHLEKLDPESLDMIYEEPMQLLVSCIRSVAQAPDGYLFADADLNAIENRVLGWIAKDHKILRVFALNRDPYIDFATYMFHRPYEELMAEYKAGDDSKRTIAKPGVLGCGYQLGEGKEWENKKTGEIEADGLLGYARNMKINLTPEQAKLSVETFRNTFEGVVESWRMIEKAAKKCVLTGKPVAYHMLRFELKEPFLLMVLPSGRALHYCRPRIESVKTPWGAWRDQVTYEQMNDKNQWVRVSTHGGKLIENATQAIARDLLAHGMRLAFYRGLDLALHVHDQIVAVVPVEFAQEGLSALQECMGDLPPWGTHEGLALPLASAGFVSKIFKKD